MYKSHLSYLDIYIGFPSHSPQNFNVSVKEHGAKALWALAGSTTSQQKYIAEKTSIPDICSMLLEDTEKLLQVGQYYMIHILYYTQLRSKSY